MILFTRFYRNFVLRRTNQLQSPKFHSIHDLELPRESVYHYFFEDMDTIAVPQSHWIFKNKPKMLFIDHVLELHPKAKEGSPALRSVSVIPLIRNYHVQNRRVRELKNGLKQLTNDRIPLIVNYALLPHRYRYPNHFFKDYFQWQNETKTAFSTINQSLNEFPRNHFFELSLPETIPSLQKLFQAQNNFTRGLLEEFRDPHSLFLLDFWKWLGEKDQESLLSLVEEKNL